ncbi:hypothetical protein GCM10009721_09610 [Terrabacter tumescens]|uniref:LigA protein n=1 Tax=Terrabacter tumescens TaxID=60443 RepID=A0ABQ2HP99_9MICO|nr:hypothetical protein [Terrabacter tumescens]GGM86869.1 hypothetical protein GCM10009721_09610 [Terrabacter tumescens]
MSDMDQRLKRALGEHTEGVRVVADLAERAIARDRSNKRRELGVAALAAGLVLAVAVPMGWGALRASSVRPLPVGPSQSTTAPTGSPSAPTNTPPSAPTPTAIPTLTADGSPAPVNLRFATGEPTGTTKVPYLIGDVIHDQSRTIRIQAEGRWGSLSRLSNDGWLVTDGDTLVSTVLDSTGLPLTEITGTTRVSASGLLIAASDVRGSLRAYDNLGAPVASLDVKTCGCSSGGSSGYEVAGVVNTTVYANRGDLEASVAWDVSTGKTRRLPFRLSVVDPATETAAVLTPGAKARTSCLELRDLLTLRTRWRLCGPLLPRTFSSNGLYLMATGYIDGLDDSQLNPDGTFRYGGLVVVRTSDGSLVLEGGGATGAGGSPVSYRMGDDSKLVVQVGSATGLRGLQRCTLEGVCEVVAPDSPRAVDIPEGEDPYTLSDN